MSRTPLTPNRRRSLPVAVLTVAAAAVATGTALHLSQSLAHSSPRFGEVSAATVNTVAFSVLAAVLLHRRVGGAIAWLAAAIGIGSAVQLMTGEYAMWGRYLRHDTVPATAAAALTCMLSVVAAFALLPLLLAVFPDGRYRSRPERAAWLAYLAAVVLTMTAAALAPGPLNNNTPGFDNPLGAPRNTLAGAVASAVPPLLVVLVGVAGGVLSLLRRWRRSQGVVRQQIRWVAFGTAVGGAALLSAPWLPGLLPKAVGGILGWLTWTLAVAVIPVTIGISVLRYHLYDLGRVVSRTVTYTLLTGLLALGYLGLVTAATRVVPQRSGLAVAASTLAVAAAFGPLRRRLQQSVDRRFNRAHIDAQRVSETFQRRLRLQVHLDEVSRDLLGVTAHTLAPQFASLWLRSP